ncbi:MAG: response regulator [Bdellovibrionaceae bacterium]|nr:response regulator [Pseudobdellovibrionaceae bacterium]NUM58294.1 response regulator [Pseudobdellovibrionaceae bacterium]
MFSINTKILIIDDMPSIRDLVRNQLKAMGFMEIYEAEDGEEGLNLIKVKYGEAQPIELVISDWNMPKMKGLELLKIVRADERFSKLPFILLTSEAEREQVTEAVLAGVSQYIVKPFSGKVFEDKLKTAYSKHFKS